MARLGSKTLAQQQGTALLMVLFILVLLSTLAVYTAEDENIAIRRAENQRDAEQSRQVALAGEKWVVKALERDALNSPNIDHLQEEWALLRSQTVQVEDGQMAVQATDEGGKFNINNLILGKMIPNLASPTAPKIESPWYLYFTRLLENLNLDIELADAVSDWIDLDDDQTGSFGAEDNDYVGADPPHLAANRAIPSVAELAFVRGFGDNELKALAPYITALPIGPDPTSPAFTKININTAPDMVLRSLDDSIDAINITNFLQSRLSGGYPNVNNVYSALSPAMALSQFTQIITVESQFFSAQSCAKFGRVDYAQQSLLQRDATTQEVLVLSRQRRYNCGVKTNL